MCPLLLLSLCLELPDVVAGAQKYLWSPKFDQHDKLVLAQLESLPNTDAWGHLMRNEQKPTAGRPRC